MIIVGNLYEYEMQLFVNIISSNKLDDYKMFDSVNIVDDVVIYKYIIKINDINTKIIFGNKYIDIPNIKPTSDNTSLYFVSCDGQNSEKYSFTSPAKYYYSCNNCDMWKKLYLDIKADKNIHKFVIHLGDQVYLDDANDELINNKIIDDTEIKRTYFNVYYDNFNKKYKKKILRTVHNIMIGDDHEFINSYKSIPNNLTPSMIKNAHLMYKTFQESLYSFQEHNIKHLLFSDSQIIIPDLRKYRQNNTDTYKKYPIFGETQMNEFENIIKRTKNIKNTYYVSTTPLIGISRLISKIAKIILGNKLLYTDDYISSNTYLNERDYVINKLFELDNNVIIIGGDYHYSELYNLTQINKETNKIKTIKEIITSPISSDPFLLRENIILQIFCRLINMFVYDRYIKSINVNINKKWSVYDYNYLKIINNNPKLICYNNKHNKII